MKRIPIILGFLVTFAAGGAAHKFAVADRHTDPEDILEGLRVYLEDDGSAPWASEETLRVLALDCEIPVPARYAIQTQDDNQVSFFSSSDLENLVVGIGRIVIYNNLESDSESITVIERRTAGHLDIYRKSYSGQPDYPFDEAVEFVEIRSLEQSLALYGEAVKLEDDIVRACQSSIRAEKAAAYRQRASGCKYNLSLWPDFDSVFESADFQAVFADGSQTGWRLSDLETGGPLAQEGLSIGDTITGICGVPFAVAMASGSAVCCVSGEPGTLTLEVTRGSKRFDVAVAASNR